CQEGKVEKGVQGSRGQYRHMEWAQWFRTLVKEGLMGTAGGILQDWTKMHPTVPS
ncbi:hypothetical protein THAOC_11105, partial [Thalassiosira oceanica]